MSHRVIFSISVFLSLIPCTTAQGPRPIDPDGDALDAQAVLARAKFGAAQATPRVVARRLVATAREMHEIQLRFFESGKSSATGQRDWAARVEEAERAANRAGDEV